MKRRDFIRKAGIATAGAFTVPYILPSGRLFASTGARKANHVVFCLYAGGVRNLESVQKAEGNLMTNLLNGTEPISPDILPAMEPLPGSPLLQPLQNYGTLFKNVKYASGPTGHYNGHTCAVTGTYTTYDLNIKDNPQFPTIFEYYRKHNLSSNSAMNAWWVSNALGPYPALNFSKYPSYGAQYGANFIAPTSLISTDGNDVLGNMKNYTNAEQTAVSKIRDFTDSNFNLSFIDGAAGVTNSETDKASLQNYITDSLNKAVTGQYNNPWGAGATMNNDMYNVFFAEEIIKLYKPELLVVNMQDVDVCHFNFTQYCNNLRKADYAVAHLWSVIQSTPGMMNDTILIIAPEHGRNLATNSSIDLYGRYAIDHTAPEVTQGGDQMAREIFCLIAGPSNVVYQQTEVTVTTGESIEIVPIIANILGFDTDIPAGLIYPYSACGLKDAFM